MPYKSAVWNPIFIVISESCTFHRLQSIYLIWPHKHVSSIFKLAGFINYKVVSHHLMGHRYHQEMFYYLFPVVNRSIAFIRPAKYKTHVKISFRFWSSKISCLYFRTDNHHLRKCHKVITVFSVSVISFELSKSFISGHIRSFLLYVYEGKSVNEQHYIKSISTGS